MPVFVKSHYRAGKSVNAYTRKGDQRGSLIAKAQRLFFLRGHVDSRTVATFGRRKNRDVWRREALAKRLESHRVRVVGALVKKRLKGRSKSVYR